MEPLEKNQIWPSISRWPPLHKNVLVNYCTTCMFLLTAMSCDVFYVGRGTLPWRIDCLFKIQDGRNFQDGRPFNNFLMFCCNPTVFRLTALSVSYVNSIDTYKMQYGRHFQDDRHSLHTQNVVHHELIKKLFCIFQEMMKCDQNCECESPSRPKFS